MESTSHQAAAKLLGVPSIAQLTKSIIARSILPGGRIEAHEFGRDQHSSASAGAVLMGVAGSTGVPDDIVRPLVDLGIGLIDKSGHLRGHDGDAESGDTSWAMSQVLSGLITRPHLVTRGRARIAAMARRLVAVQGENGWPLRAGEEPNVLFAFYPALALTQLVRTKLVGPHDLVVPLCRTAEFLRDAITGASLTIEEQLLAHFAYERLRKFVPVERFPPLAGSRRQSLASCWDSVNGLQVTDRTIVIHRQPVWHSTTWYPLLYLCTRKWLPPLDAVSASVGGALTRAFDIKIDAWSGPVGARPGPGTSWASALALRATVALGNDLTKAAITVDEFQARAAQVDSLTYRYDVAISFAGTDRLIAESIAARMKSAGLRTFYDRDYQHALLGEDLGAYLHSTYFKDSRFAVVIVSRAFMDSKWAGNWEWRAVLARMQQQTTGYVLPYILEEVTLPGLNPTTGHIAARDYTPEEFADLVIRKARNQLG